MIARLLPKCFPIRHKRAVRLTDPNVASLKLAPGQTDLLVFDDSMPGFGVRLRAGGKKTWLIQYRIKAQQRRFTLGSVGTLDAAEARRRAKSALAQVALGQDPQAEKAAARIPATREMTLGELVDLYLPVAEKKLKSGTYDGIVIHLKKHWQPLHKMGLPDLLRRHVAAELTRIARDSGPYGANRSRAALSALFSYAIGEGLADINPVIGTNRATDEEARDRVLTDDELRAVWLCSGPGDYGRIVRLLILTAQRRGEVGSLPWSELDLGQALWSIPGKRTKNKLPHDVPLSKPALKEIATAERRQDRDLLFGLRTGPFQGWTGAKEELDKRIEASTGRTFATEWRLHDLRRTAATRMGDIGILPHVIEAVLNHTSGSKGGVAGVYNRALYNAEKRQALDLWAERVAGIVS